MNGSKGLKRVSSTSNVQTDPLDAAREALSESKDATRLLEYSEDFDEPTGRTEVNVRIEQPSRPEIEMTDSGDSRPIAAALRFRRWPQVAALAILVAGALAIAWLRSR